MFLGDIWDTTYESRSFIISYLNYIRKFEENYRNMTIYIYMYHILFNAIVIKLLIVSILWPDALQLKANKKIRWLNRKF